MVIKQVSYTDFRNMESAVIELTPGTNVLWGNNAQGKTNILEGIYFFARGKSFRATAERELVRFGAQYAHAEILFRRDADARDTLLGAHIPLSGKKRLERNGVGLSGVSEMIGDLCAVLFCPAHLSLVAGSPGARRSFLDIAIAQLSPLYIANLRKFNRALEQRNALIKSASQGTRVSDAQWEAYAAVMAECAAYIAAARYSYTGFLSAHVGRIFAEMTGEREKPELFYKTHLLPPKDAERSPSDDGEDTALIAATAADGSITDMPLPCDVREDPAAVEHIERLLCDNIEREIRVGSTLYGVHKDDVTIKLNSLDARAFASQGQTRSLSLAMKLAEGEICRLTSGEYPVFLLDDVLSELDAHRREYILGALDGRQIIVTSCEPELYRMSADVRLIEVEDGRIITHK